MPDRPERTVRARRRHRLFTFRRIAIGVIVASATGAITLSFRALATESVSLAAEQRLLTYQPALDAGHVPADLTFEDMSLDAPARALIADATLRAHVARLTTDVARRNDLLDRARLELQSTDGSAPYRGEMWAMLAYVDSLRLGVGAPETRRSFARSYADAPYLAHAAHWRVAFGLAEFPNLPPETRYHVLNEAVWLSRRDSDALAAVMAQARASAAYRPFMILWLRNRAGDAGFGPI